MEKLFFERDYDIVAIVTNNRSSKNDFYSGYRPAFDIHKNYSTTGEIKFIECDRLSYGSTAKCLIKFLTPDVYPKSLWIGKKIYFREGSIITGSATVVDIINKVLESEIPGIEGALSLN